jgi:16S rRNA A1518/A1519 N6-dimethyltransferase RsmA/KsgA/DIM1 with predicted DNA glycosylase/AP lyase activity
MIRLFFQQRRKMAINSFVKFSDLTKQVAEEIFQQAEILTRARPQELSLKDYIRLYNTWRKYEEEKM